MTLFLREDEEFRYLIEAIPKSRLGPLLTSQSSPVNGFTMHCFGPVLAAGRAAGLLRDEASDPEIVEWLVGIMLLLTSRLDLDEFAQRRRLRLFIIPALFS